MELIIVIAVIAVLAAVLIPTFSNLIQKANEAKDTALVSNLNKAVAMDTTSHDTMYDVLKVAEDVAGINVAKINAAANSNEILWDSVNKCFVYSVDGTIKYIPDTKSKDVKGDYDYWKISSNQEDVKANKYSIYWTGAALSEITATTGFDAGEAEIGKIIYQREDNATAQTVTIRTNSAATTLAIDSSKDTVKHYDAVGTVKVIAVDRTASYHEFGTANTLIVNDGHIVVENNATVENVIIEKAENAAVSLDNNGEIAAVAGVDNSVAINGVSEENKIDTKTELTGDGGYVKLTSAQTVSSQHLFITKDTVLDLNGKTITVENKLVIAIEANVTIIDSSEEQSGTIKKDFLDGNALILVQNGGKLTLNGGTLIAQGSYNTSVSSYKQVIDVNAESTLIVNGGTIYNKCSTTGVNDYTGAGIGAWGTATVVINAGEIKSDHGFALAGNGGTGKGGTSIVVNGGILTGGEVAIYNPQYGSLIINGGTITAETCVYVKSGSLSINGGVFNAIGEKKAFAHSGGGCTSTGDCIVLESCNYPGGTPMAYVIKNAKMTSANGQLIVGYVYQNNAEIVITSDLKFEIFHVE